MMTVFQASHNHITDVLINNMSASYKKNCMPTILSGAFKWYLWLRTCLISSLVVSLITSLLSSIVTSLENRSRFMWLCFRILLNPLLNHSWKLAKYLVDPQTKFMFIHNFSYIIVFSHGCRYLKIFGILVTKQKPIFLRFLGPTYLAPRCNVESCPEETFPASMDSYSEDLTPVYVEYPLTLFTWHL